MTPVRSVSKKRGHTARFCQARDRLGDVGPTDHYAHVGFIGKLILSACMLLGRLELFTVLVLFFPSFWRK